MVLTSKCRYKCRCKSINVGINKTEKAVLDILIGNSDKSVEEIAKEIGVTKRTIERTLASLKNKKLIERFWF